MFKGKIMFVDLRQMLKSSSPQKPPKKSSRNKPFKALRSAAGNGTFRTSLFLGDDGQTCTHSELQLNMHTTSIHQRVPTTHRCVNRMRATQSPLLRAHIRDKLISTGPRTQKATRCMATNRGGGDDKSWAEIAGTPHADLYQSPRGLTFCCIHHRTAV